VVFSISARFDGYDRVAVPPNFIAVVGKRGRLPRLPLCSAKTNTGLEG